MTTPNPKRRMSGDRMKSDAMIRREKLEQIHTTGSTAGINKRSLARFEEKGYIATDGTLTKRGLAVMKGRIGAAGRGAVDFSQANREAGKVGGMNSERGHAARAAALRGTGERKETRAERINREKEESILAQEWEAQEKARAAKERKEYGKILPAHALKISLSDGGPITRDHIQDLTGEGWQVLPAGTAPGKVGRTLPGQEIMAFNPEPLGPTGKAHAVIVWSHGPLDRAIVESFRAAGWDVSAAPKRYREEPAPVKNPRKKKNPSTAEEAMGEHASAAARLALKKAAAFFGRDDLVNNARELKGYEAPTACVEIGDLVALEYDSHKFDGKSRIYRHETTRKRKMLISLDGSTIIIWPPLKVTKRGIEG